MPGRLRVRESPLTRHGTRVIVLAILGTAAYLVLHYQSLPWLLPVHFKLDGTPNGWQYRTIGRVFDSAPAWPADRNSRASGHACGRCSPEMA